MAKTDLTAQRLRELLDYNPETGAFHWLAQCGKKKPGEMAGVRASGYIQIRIATRLYYGHRLAWLYVHGEWPAAQIDHINGVRDDNRIINLRDASALINIQNQLQVGRNKTGFTGVQVCRQRFSAHLMADRKKLWLGLFDTATEAHAAYLAAKLRYHPDCQRS